MALLYGESFPYTSETSTIENERRATVAATIASMQVVRRYQMSGGIVSLPDKSDRSALTVVDEKSEFAAKEALHMLQPNIPILGEESGMTEGSDKRKIYMIDPIDGTRPFKAEAPTPTVIGALFDNDMMQFEAVAIGEPATGRLWYSDGLTTSIAKVDGAGNIDLRSGVRQSQVWDGEYTDNGLVLVENSREFKRGERLILSDENNRSLFGNLQDKINIQNYGSNGLHHALVANGGEGVAGAITTSMGGEWDTAGVLVVVAAGGMADGFRIMDDRKLESADPFNPFDCDMVISANNRETLDFLRNSLVESVNGSS